MPKHTTRIPRILMPKAGTDLAKWAVIACDQYTSQPEYWEKLDREVGGAPSTLRITLPEVYLEEPDVESRIRTIHDAMGKYLADGILEELPAGIVLTARDSGGACPRKGPVDGRGRAEMIIVILQIERHYPAPPCGARGRGGRAAPYHAAD